jgi:predicted kinase
MKTVFFLIGPPGSGKSTWRAKYLSKTKRPTTIISSDDMIDKYAEQHGMTYSEAFKVVSFNAINTSITQNYKSALERGDDVIIDRTNMNAKSRKNFLDMVPSDYKK